MIKWYKSRIADDHGKYSVMQDDFGKLFTAHAAPHEMALFQVHDLKFPVQSYFVSAPDGVDLNGFLARYAFAECGWTDFRLSTRTSVHDSKAKYLGLLVGDGTYRREVLTAKA
jgi:hypothetical protein